MSTDEMKQLLARVHEDITLLDYNDNKVPCIILPEKRFNEIIQKVAGKPVSVDTNLKILQDGLGHVFVEVILCFSYGDIVEKFLLYANDSLDFFESLVKTSMLALSSPHAEIGSENVFMIQLPRPEKAENAFEMIKKGINTNSLI